MIYGIRRAGLVLLIATSVEPAEAQDCQVILQQLLSGGADVGWAMRAQDYYNRNCLGRQPQQSMPQRPYPTPQPTYQAPVYNPPPTYQAPHPRVEEFAKLGEFVMSGQPLRKDIPLSSGVRQMDTVRQPPPAPQNYSDPFTTGPANPPTQSMGPLPPPSKPRGSIWDDPNNWVQLAPPSGPPAPQQQPATSSVPCPPDVCSPPITGFDRPAIIRPWPR